jgi:hypothetical protein
VEAAFKPAEGGGYVFHCPNPWLFGHMRTYLVNEDQKAKLAGFLRQRQRIILRLLAVYLLAGFALTMWFQQAGGTPDTSTTSFAAMVVLALLGMLALALVPHFYLTRKIRPLLATLPRAEEPVSFRQQIFGVAAVISNLHLALGGLGGFLVAASNIRSIYGVLYGGEDGSLLWSGFGLLCGIALASYFAYLTILKRRLKRRPN